MVNLSGFFIKNNILLILLTSVFVFGGIFSFANLNRNEDPGFKIRTAGITTYAEGLNAKKVDSYITRQIEKELLKMEEIEDIREESLFGQSVIYADLYEYYDLIQPVWDRLRRKIELAKADLPEGVSPVVNDEFGDVFGALIGVSKVNATYEELYDLTKSLRDEFLKLKSRGKVEIFGEREETLYLYFKNSFFSNLKLTPDILSNFVKSVNITGGGSGISSDKDYIEINSADEFKSLEDIKKRTLNISGKPIFFQDIFDIQKTVKKPEKRLVRSNGEDALIIGISLKEGGNILKWGEEIKNKIKDLRNKNPGAKIEILALQSDYVKLLTDKFTSSLFESIFAVILIVLLILGFKTGIITGGIIFATVTSTFFVMKALNIGLDKISLSALIISLGILVDNSIVIAEGCLKNGVFEKEKIKECVISTAYKFQNPLLIVTLTTSLSFLPVFLAKSAVGEYASNLFRVVFITLVFSWFYSVSLLPYLMYKFGHKDALKEKKPGVVDFLKKKIDFCLDYPKTVVFAGIILSVFSFAAFLFVPKIFFPDSDRNMFEIRLNLKNGVSFEETKRATTFVENYLKNQSDVTDFSSYIGTTAPRYVLSASPEAERTNFSMILINVKDYKTVNKNIKEAKNFINRNLPNVQAVVRKIPLGPPYDAPVEIRIINNDLFELFKLSKLVSSELASIGGVYLVKNNWGDFVPEYKITVNENAAIMAGISPDYLFDYLNSFYNGKTLTYYYRNDVKIPVVLKGEESEGRKSDGLKNLSFYSVQHNGIIPLEQVANVVLDFTPSRILRRNNSYVLTVQGWNDESANARKITEKISSKLDKISGLNYEFGGIVEKSGKGNKSVTENIPAAFGIILLILAGYFNSIKKPFLIAFCAVLALSGANVGLLLTGSDFGFMTFLGYICLVGICMNNGVILVNEIKEETEKEIKEAAKSRVEPVLLTCLTTMGGMLPLWVKNDPMFSTLAISIICGLLTSIMITLFFLPSLFLLLSGKTK